MRGWFGLHDGASGFCEQKYETIELCEIRFEWDLVWSRQQQTQSLERCTSDHFKNSSEQIVAMLTTSILF